MSILDIFNSNPEGNTPIEQASPLRRFLIGLGGQESVDMYNQPALTQLGADLASGAIDQTQYDRRMAQYAPKEYQKMRLLQMGNGRPSALQINDEMERALRAGDYEKANRIFSLVRSQAYGVDTYSPERNPYAQPQQQGSALRNFGTQPAIQPFANQRPTVTDLPVIEQPPSVDNPIPTRTDNFPKPSSIAEQQAANAGLVKGAEETAKQNAILEKAAAIEEEKARGAPMPANIVVMQDELQNELDVHNNILSNAKEFERQIDAKELDLSFLGNIRKRMESGLGVGDEEAAKLANFDNFIESLRNDTLLLHKGTQTEGDAKRALETIMANRTSPVVVSKRLKEVAKLNEKAIQQKQKRSDIIRSEYNRKPLPAKEATQSSYAPTEQIALPPTLPSPNKAPSSDGWSIREVKK